MPSARSVIIAAFSAGLRADAARIVISGNSTPVLRWGNPDCPCIGIDEIDGVTETVVNGKAVDFPADLGAHCEAWDEKSNPACPGASWCKQKWCYVDPCKCKIDVPPKESVYIPGAEYQGKPVHFSYATCGNKDTYTADEAKKTKEDIKKTCSVRVEAQWGSENCRCIGIGGQAGITKVEIDKKYVDFPADTGAYCQAWESDRHPACHDGANAPAWCHQAWCYVDPCSCTVPTPPKISTYVPEGNFQGKPVYYSYTACGGTDEYTAGVKLACVNQPSQMACQKLEKCAWDGERGRCLGKELVEVCKRSGASGPQALLALSLAFFASLF